MSKKELSVKIENGMLHITMPINSKPETSASGKTLVVASTRGNKETTATVNGQHVFLGLNAYIYPSGK